MTYRGQVKQGVIVLDPPAQLPEGAVVEVHAAEGPLSHGAWPAVERENDEALVHGSVAATTVSLPLEDFSDWER